MPAQYPDVSLPILAAAMCLPGLDFALDRPVYSTLPVSAAHPYYGTRPEVATHVQCAAVRALSVVAARLAGQGRHTREHDLQVDASSDTPLRPYFRRILQMLVSCLRADVQLQSKQTAIRCLPMFAVVSGLPLFLGENKLTAKAPFSQGDWPVAVGIAACAHVLPAVHNATELAPDSVY